MKKTHYDILWKNAIRIYFKNFLHLVLPNLAKGIDWRFKFHFLDQEFHELLGKQKKGERRTDVLVKVRLKSGVYQWVYIHIEIQSYYDAYFAERMFQIYYRIRDRYTKSIVALAVFTDKTEMQTRIKETLFGTELNFKFNSYYIKDQNSSSLLTSENPFSLVILASLYALKTNDHSKARQRFAFKEELFRLFLESRYTEKEAQTMYVFLDQILKLPNDLSLSFNNKILKMYQEQEFKFELSEGLDEAVKGLAARIFKRAYDEDLEKVLENSHRLEEIEAEMSKFEAAKSKAEAAKSKAEAAKFKAEAAKFKAEAAKSKAEAKFNEIVINLYKSNISIDNIVEIVDMPIEEISAILAANKLT